MSTKKPLATVDPHITIAGGVGVVRLGGPRGPSWGANPSMWQKDDEITIGDTAELLAADINKAHWAATEKLRGQLAALREALVDVVDKKYSGTCLVKDDPCFDPACCSEGRFRSVLASIDADERFYSEAQAKEMAAVECDRLLESDERFRAAVEKARADGYAKGRRDTHTLMIGGEIREDYDQDGGPWECCVKANGGAECELNWGHSGPHQGHTDDGNAVYW